MAWKWSKRGGGTIPGHDVRSTAAMMRLAQTHVDLANRLDLQMRKTIILTRWVISLSVLMAIAAASMIAILLFG
jgi:hypothetical protein